jgi:hypothetical protein
MEFQDFLMEVQASFADARVANGDLVVFQYEIPVGGHLGDSVRLGLARVGDWPLSCPPGPHISPRLGHPDGNVHASPLGDDWEYWSRPFPGWADTDRTFRTYMAHVRALLARLP